MCIKGLISCFFEVSESPFQSREMGSFNDIGDGLWFILQHEVKQGLASGGVGTVVVNKFNHGNVFNPCLRVNHTNSPLPLEKY